MSNLLKTAILILILAPPGYSQERYTLKKDLVIGDDMTGLEFRLSRISDVKTDNEGNIYLLERSNCQILKFNPYGVHLKTIGTKGDGFGEFQEPLQLIVGKDGKLFVRDRRLKRIVIFNSESSYFSMIKFTDLNVIDFYPHGTNRIFFVYKEESSIKIGLFNEDAELVQEIVKLPEYRHVTVGLNKYQVPDYFSGRPFWAFSPDGLIFAGHSKEYVITCYDENGESIRTIEGKFTPQRTKPKEKEWYFQKYKIRDSEKGMIFFPEFKAHFDRILVTPAGDLWVRTINPLLEPENKYEILDSEGNLQGTVGIKGRLCDIRKDFVYVTDQSRFGLPIVVKYKLEKTETDKDKNK